MKKSYRAKEVLVLMCSFADRIRNYPPYNDEMDKTLLEAKRFIENTDNTIDDMRCEDDYTD